MKNPIHKDPNWFYHNNFLNISGPTWFAETISFMQSKMDFAETDNDLVSFIPISFSEFTEPVVTQIWTGPKNVISGRDLDSYLKKNGYNNVDYFRSTISYR